PALELKRTLTRAELLLAERRPAEAMALLETPPGADAAPALVARYHRLRADALDALGRYIDSARERVELELLVSDPVALSENRRLLWESLSKVPPAALAAAYVPPPSTLGGWLELAAVARDTVTDADTFQQALALWRDRYPGHPAGEQIVPLLLDASAMEWTPPRTVALLLPLSGQFEQAGRAVRDGFLAAWYSDAAATRPVVLVRDTSSGDIWTIYNQVVEAGAELVVGPLRREQVTELARQPAMPVPTLALNFPDEAESGPSGSTPAGQAPGTSSPYLPRPAAAGPPGAQTPPRPATRTAGLFQFALSPESEARRVAEYAWLSGHGHAAMLVPNGTWGTRVGDAFDDEWRRLGGVVVARQDYPAEGGDLSSPVARLLQVDESEQRFRRVNSLLGGGVKHEARRRQDADFVFMAAFPVQARQLRPQLEFHHALDLPVFATSHVYSGIADPAIDTDVDGVIFGDMPWVLSPQAEYADLRRDVAMLWSDSLGGLVRLYGFGADAYHVVKQLGRLRAQRYAEIEGVTGRLSLNERNQVTRKLMWARFEKGVPKVLRGSAAVP
ncbi:MAG: penicillin-binding protein activator, partial [Gammaproteobacteria bacterium]|nr:penicillin-binding protein activator [Gammaproteobacteria bacterium]